MASQREKVDLMRPLYGLRTFTFQAMVDVHMSNEAIAERIEWACKQDQWFETFARPETVMATPAPQVGQPTANLGTVNHETQLERSGSPVA
jgi:hypothetical protein